MTTRSKSPNEQRSLIPWRKRANFRVGKTRRQRKAQYTQQTNALLMILLTTVVAGGLIVYFNWRGAGSTKTVSCTSFPEYCVPLAGDFSATYESLESPDARELDAESEGAEGVVRGIDADGIPFMGDPNAPIHFATVADFSCTHCNDYHRTDLHQFIQEYVLSGQATLGFVMTTGTGGQYSELASQAALCAGEQGAFWEMADELFRLSNAMGVRSAFSLNQIENSADDMGLDSRELANCATSGRYTSLLSVYRTIAQDNGISSTPTLMVKYGDAGSWTPLDHGQRGYASMKNMTEEANRAEE